MTYDTESEAHGKYVKAFVDSAGEVSPVFQNKLETMFTERLGEIDPDEWYNTGDVVEVYSSVVDDVGPKSATQAGRANGRVVDPPEDADLRGALEYLNQAHEQAFRNSDREYPCGRYTFSFDGDRLHVGVDEDYGFPQPFVEGVYQELIKRFGPGDGMPRLSEVEPEPNEQFAWETTL